MQIPALYGILLIIMILLHYMVIMAGVAFIFEKRTRVLACLVVAADLLLLVAWSLAEGYFFFHNLPPYFWFVLPLAIITVLITVWLYIKLGGNRLIDHSFKKRYARVFTVLFWVALASAWLKSFWGIH